MFIILGRNAMPKFFATMFLIAFFIAGFFAQSFGQAQVRVAPGYEDSVRILILWNNPGGSCGWMPAVGPQTRDFTVKSISGGKIGNPDTNSNIKILPTETTTWDIVTGLWPGKLPHVIVHVNAGWYTLNGPNNGAALQTIYEYATQKYIGIVEIGDDAAYLGINVFGFTNTVNMPAPISDGTQYTNPTDTMFVGFYPNRDTLVDSTNFPFLKGIIHNAIVILGKPRADFKTYVPGGTMNTDTLRCQADADQYNVDPSFQNRLVFLGYQNTSRNGVLQVASPLYPELDVVVAFQDTIHFGGNIAVRRAVALSMQPQFLKNTQAMYQLTYDAIMFASLAWQLLPISKITLQVGNATIKAGDTTTIRAKLFRDVVEAPEMEDSVSWRLDPLTKKPGDTLLIVKGKTTRLTGTLAGHKVDVIATFQNSGGATVTATATITIVPADPYRIVIEADSINSNPNLSDPVGTITLDSSTNDKKVYAMTYDRFGNFTGIAPSATAWTSSNISSATVSTPGSSGMVHRVTKFYDTLTVAAAFGSLAPGTVKVVLQTGTVIAIRLVKTDGTAVTAINMTTDDTMLVKVQVQWSNAPGTWVDGAGSWALNPANAITWSPIHQLPLGSGTGSWTLDPVTPGISYLTVSAGSTASSTVPVTITPAPPSRATIELAHPSDSIIAGRPFKVVVKIYNTDGLYPDPWCSKSATFNDVIGNGGKTVIPVIYVNGNPTPVPLGTPTGECFIKGVDTVTAVLFNASINPNKPNELSVVINNGSSNLPLTKTPPFPVYPGPLAALRLEYSNGNDMPGPDTLYYPDGAVNIYSRGYDLYGNFIGDIRSKWDKSGYLPSFTPPDAKQINVYIEANAAILTENGMVTASAPSGVLPGTNASDTVQVIIVPRAANLVEATTKDMNGNGYLDQIWVKFDKAVPASKSAGSIIVKDIEHTVVFTVDSIRPQGSTGDSTSAFIIYLHDIDSTKNGILEPDGAVPQTSWRPLLSITGLKGVADFTGQKCKDGAGPVIWRVTCYKSDAKDRSQDSVTVTFSEPIQASNGNDFSINIAPSLVFSTWKKDGNSLAPDTSLLACNTSVQGGPCIGVFYKILGPGTVQFYMINQKTLFDYDFFNIRTQPAIQVSDKANPANLPVINNQKVQVIVFGVISPMKIGPNPATPTLFNPDAPNNDPSVIVFKNTPNATHYAKDHGGTVLRFYISPGQGRITAYLNIYDVIGNVVNSVHKDGPNDDLMAEIRNTYRGANLDTASNYTYDIYWNGVNARGMKTAPGIYHAFLYQTLYKPNGIVEKSRQQGIIGIARMQ